MFFGCGGTDLLHDDATFLNNDLLKAIKDYEIVRSSVNLIGKD